MGEKLKRHKRQISLGVVAAVLIASFISTGNAVYADETDEPGQNLRDAVAGDKIVAERASQDLETAREIKLLEDPADYAVGAVSDLVSNYFAEKATEEPFYDLGLKDGGLIVYSAGVLGSDAQEFVSKAAKDHGFSLNFDDHTVDISRNAWLQQGDKTLTSLNEKFGSVVSVGRTASSTNPGFTVALHKDSAADEREIVEAFKAITSSKMPVEVTRSEYLPNNSGRQGDLPPYSGGARIKYVYTKPDPGVPHPSYSTCTTSFAAVKNKGGAVVEVTAGHCGDMLGYPWEQNTYLTPANWTYGFGYVKDNQADAMYIVERNDRSFAPTIYGGAWNDDAKKTVGLSADPTAASSSATMRRLEGSYSGVMAVTSLVELDAYTTSQFGSTNSIGPGFRYRLPHKAVGVGDSGAPIVYVRSDGKVTVQGIHVKADGASTANCWGGDPSRTSECWIGGFAVNVKTIETRLDLKVRLG